MLGYRVYGAPGSSFIEVPALPRVCRVFRRQRSAGAKAQIFFSLVTARLKSCPDTKPQSGDARKARVFPRPAELNSGRNFGRKHRRPLTTAAEGSSATLHLTQPKDCRPRGDCCSFCCVSSRAGLLDFFTGNGRNDLLPRDTILRIPFSAPGGTQTARIERPRADAAGPPSTARALGRTAPMRDMEIRVRGHHP
jgi:hypothetical protein